MTTYPNVGDYQAAVQHPARAFTLPSLQQAVFDTNSWGPVLSAGQNAVVFRANVDGSARALRCYLRAHSATAQHYSAIDQYVAEHGLASHIGRLTWHEAAIRVNSSTWPVLAMDWVEGRLLDTHVGDLAVNSQVSALADLAKRWRDLVRTLQRASFTHGDLQHGNVMVGSDGQLHLIDLDSAWIPPFATLPPPAEVGHENYQHPDRMTRAADWGRLGDTFSALVIYLSLVVLAKSPALWLSLNTGNNLLFERQDFVLPFATVAWKQLARIGDPEVDRLAMQLQECCAAGWTPAAGGLEVLVATNWWEKADAEKHAPAAMPEPAPADPPRAPAELQPADPPRAAEEHRPTEAAQLSDAATWWLKPPEQAQPRKRRLFRRWLFRRRSQDRD